MRKGMWKKGLTVAMAAAMLAGPVSVPAVFNNGVSVVKADETNKGQDVYVLMNIPYADFYKAELNKKNTVKVDATTSATKTKTRSTWIPNSVLTNDSITNVTAMEKRRLEIKVGISYESDLLLAKQILRELIEKDPELLDREETQVFVDELGDSAVILGLRAWVKTEEFWNTKWRMNEQIKLEFDKRGIRIPYPQMDVHMHR